MTDIIQLRPATFEDAERLLQWCNVPGTLSASLDSDKIPLENHLTWLKKQPD